MCGRAVSEESCRELSFREGLAEADEEGEGGEAKDGEGEAQSGLVTALEEAQGRNEELIGRLDDKCREYDLISANLADLQNEASTLLTRHPPFGKKKGRALKVKALKGRFAMGEAAAALRTALVPGSFVPAALVADVEAGLGKLDGELAGVKAAVSWQQQEAAEAAARERATSQKYLDHVEQLQKSNFHLLQRSMAGEAPPPLPPSPHRSRIIPEMSLYEPDMRCYAEMMPTYESLYSFTLNLIRKVDFMIHFEFRRIEITGRVE